MQVRFLTLIFSLFCLQSLIAQTTTPWVPGTPCTNCPINISSKLGSAQVANGNNTLATTYTQSACGLNYIEISKPLFKRNFAAIGTTVTVNQPASYVVTGIPPCAYVLKAFLYSGASGNTVPITVTITNASTSVTATYSMTNIGTCADKCWGYGGTQSYRGDVTGVVTGNGTYVISGFPVFPQTPNFDTDGATLFIIYADPSQPYTGSIIIADGCQGITGTVNSLISGFNVCATPSITTGFGIIADLQRISNTDFRFNSTVNNYSKLQATDKVWDFVTAQAGGATIGQTTANFGVTTTGDCYNFLMAGMYYQTTCLTCGGASGPTSIIPVYANSATICTGSSATLTAGPAPAYTWNPGNTYSNTIVVSPTVSTYYSAAIVTTAGCGYTTVLVQVDPAPTLTLIPSPATVCPGLTSIISCSGASTYTLLPSGPSGSNIPVNPTVTSIYTVAATSSIGCTNSQTVTVSVFSLAPVVPTSTSPLCAGQSLSMTVGAALSYTWTGPGNYIHYFQNPVITNATATNSGVYTITVLGPNSCVNSKTIHVIVNPQATVIPTVTAFPPICNTTPPFNLTVTPSGGGWSGNVGVTTGGLLSPTIVPTGTTTAIYTVYVGPCLNSKTITIDKSIFNTAALTNSVPNLCVTSPVFNLMNIVQSAVSGTWTGPGVAGNFSFNPQPLLTGTYNITYSTTSSPNPLACPQNTTISVSVTNTQTPVIAPIPEFCNNQPAFSITVTPSGGTFFGNSAVTLNGVIIPSLAVAGTGTYSIPDGPCLNTNTFSLFPSIYNTAALSSNSLNVCAHSNSINLSALAQSTVNGNWSGPSVSSGFFIPAGLPTNTYYLVYNTTSSPNPTLCSDSQTLMVHLLNPVAPTIADAGPFCSISPTVQLAVTAVTGGNWVASSHLSPTGVLIPSLCSVGLNAVQFIVGTPTCFVQQTKYISVEAFVPADIIGMLPDFCNTGISMNLMPLVLSNTGVWSGPGITGTSFNPALTGAGNFVLNYNTASFPSGLCADNSTLAVKVFSLASPAITKIGPFCDIQPSKQFLITPLGGYFSGVNNNAVSSNGVFNPGMAVIGSNLVTYNITQGPCTAFAQTTVMVEKFVPADFVTSGPAYCKTDAEINLNSLAQNVGGDWSGSGVIGYMFNPEQASPGSNLITYQTHSSPTPSLCVDTKTILIRVDEIPRLKLPENTIRGCSPFPLFIANPGAAGGNGLWNFGDGSELQETLEGAHNYTAAGSYSVVFNYTFGACSTQSLLPYPVIVNEKPTADFVFSPEEITVSTSQINLVNLSSNKEHNSYDWDIQGIGHLYDLSPVINYSQPGNYQVTLIAKAYTGCSDEVTKLIEVKNEFSVYFPNTFSPNGDGLNDEFLPVYSPFGLNTSSFKLEIFDRWGHIIFSTNDVTKGWNGTVGNKGQERLKEGVYVYIAKYKDLDGKLYQKIGNISLLVK